LFEVIDHLITAFDCEYINEEELNDFRNETLNCIKIVNRYIAYLKRAKDGNNSTQ